MEPAVHIRLGIDPNSIRRARKHRSMLLATIICSDPSCTEELEVAVRELDEVDGFVCDCGHGFVLIEVAELREPDGLLVSLPARRGTAERRAA
jgi:hypothetical protein